MPRRGNLRRVVVFKVDDELGSFLSSLPNASEFVRQAVLATLNRRCPLCHGAGKVPVGVGEHYAAVLTAHPPGQKLPRQRSSDGAPTA